MTSSNPGPSTLFSAPEGVRQIPMSRSSFSELLVKNWYTQNNFVWVKSLSHAPLCSRTPPPHPFIISRLERL